MKKLLKLSRSRPAMLKVAEDLDYIDLQIHVCGEPDETTGMVLNLIHLDENLNQIHNFIGQINFPTIREALLACFQEGQRLFKVYEIRSLMVSFYQPHLNVSYSYDGNKIAIELKKFMRYQDSFGYATVGFDFESFSKLNDRERRQDYWQMGMAESPVLALKGRFPLASYWTFSDQITQEVQRLERK